MNIEKWVRQVWLGALLTLALGAGVALATTPQTIVIDGINDFLPGNLIEDDTGDTEHATIDIGGVYATNDAVSWYLGLEHDQGAWSTVQIGVAIDVGTPGGGITDPWGRQLQWEFAANKPDFMFYVNLDNNWQAGYSWDGASWVQIGAAGPGALGWATSTGFNELAVLMGTMGVGAGDPINFEAWITQDGGTKGPLDAAHNDGSQLSTPGSTTFDTDVAIPMLGFHDYTAQAAVDPDPPFIESIGFSPWTPNSVDVIFNEPVDETTAETISNWNVPGHTVIQAHRNPGSPNIVALTFASDFGPEDAPVHHYAMGIQDLAGNTIVDNGTTNVACLGLKNVTFRGKFGPFIDNQGAGPHAFSIEGDQDPLTFDPVCDTGIMVDTGVDDIWEFTTIMGWTVDCATGLQTKDFEWKTNYNCGTWEPLASNRVHTLDLATGTSDVIEFYWNDQDPSAFTAHDIDVDFFVNVDGPPAKAVGDTIGISGSVPTLGHDWPPAIQALDDGMGIDVAAGDGIYSARVRFPAGTEKNVVYKFRKNSAYECDLQADRNLFLNDELFDIAGGALGPLVLPQVNYDYCHITWSPVQVVFSVDFNNTAFESIRPTDVVSINGTPNGEEPAKAEATFDWTVPSKTDLKDDGVAPDLVAGDKIYTVAVVFPDSNDMNVEYKYLLNQVYECPTQANRSVSLDPSNFDDIGNPQVLPVDSFQRCNLPSDVPDLRAGGLWLDQNNPNPFNPSTEIRFEVDRAGAGSLRIFNLRGELVRVLRNGELPAGPGSVIWDGRNEEGRLAGSGVYFYRLQVGSSALTKRMILLK